MIGVCLHCNEPVEEVGRRSAIHLNGLYRCGFDGREAELATPESLTVAEEQAREQGYADGYREAEYEYEGKVDDAYDDGRHEFSCDILRRIESGRREDRADAQILNEIEELCLTH